jgi:hypothetical protein
VKNRVGIFTQITGALWIGFVTIFYFLSFANGEITWRISHKYYINIFHSILAGNPGIFPLFSIVVVVSGEYFLICLWRRFYAKEKDIDINFSPFALVIIFSFMFFLIAFMWLGFHHIFREAFITPYPGIFSHYGFILAALSIVLLVCASTGKYVFSRLKREEPYNLKEFLLSFGMGAVLVTLTLFILGLFGWLRSAPVWSIFIVLLSVAYKELWQWLRAFFQPRIHFQGAYTDVRILLFLVFSIVLSHNVLALIRPIPIGWDDTAVYMNVPHLLAQGGQLLRGIDAYSWGLFMSLGYLLFHSATIAHFLSFLGGILAFAGLYVSIQLYAEHRNIAKSQANTYALFVATLFCTLPTVMFQSTSDMKVDLDALFFMLLAFISFLSWRKEGQHDLKSLCLSGLFMGFAFTIKYTALFYIVAMSFYTLFYIVQRKERKACLAMLLFSVCIWAPFIPYGIKNITEAKQLSIQSLRSGESTAPVIAMNPPLTGILGQSSDVASTGVQEEQGRYLGFDHGIRKYLLLPFTVTFNPVVSGAYVDIGYTFLAIIPLMAIIYIRTTEEEETKSLQLRHEILIAGSIYWMLWVIFAGGVIWYGYGGFIFLLILIVEVIHRLNNPDWTFLRYVTNIAIIFWLICAICLRTVASPAFSIDPIGLAYAGGTIDENGYMKRYIPIYLNISNIINNDIDTNRTNPPKIYRVGTFIKYFIHQNDMLVLDDNQLDIFMSLTRDHDDKKAIARFKNAGFKYLIIDTDTPELDKTPGKTLRAKYQALTKFIERNKEDLNIIIDEPKYAIKFIRIL